MKFSKPLPRRTVLRSAGISIGLPLLEAMAPIGKTAFAADQKKTKFLACYVPTGFNKAAWGEKNTDIADSKHLKILNDHKQNLLVLRGCSNTAQNPDGDGGAHAHGTGAFLTGVRLPKNTEEKYPRGNPSVDQRMDELFGKETPISSLQLAAQPFGAPKPTSYKPTGDTKYSSVWTNHISWSRDGNRVANYWSPAQVFAQIYGTSKGTQPVDGSNSAEKSVLDFVMGDVTALKKKLGSADKENLDEYLEGLRSLERSLASEGGTGGSCDIGKEPDGIKRANDPFHAEKIIDLMGELAVKAFQCDATRIITLMFDQGATNRSFDKMFPKTYKGETHHFTTHKPEQMLSHAIDIEQWEMQRFKVLLDKLEQTKGTDGNSLMESAMVFFSSEVNEGSSHGRHNMPIVIAGRANGRLKTGGYIQLRDKGPNDFCNLFETFLDIMGDPDHGKFGNFGKGRGKIGEILA